MRVFLTGATGFLGEYLLLELLERGHSVWCLYRDPAKRMDTVRFLSGFGLPRQVDALHWVQGDLMSVADSWPDWAAAAPDLRRADTLLHCAASMQLHMDSRGEPLRTNAGSAEALQRLLRLQPMQTHLISTAYVCGRVETGSVAEKIHPRGNFVNVYEESKWEAERQWSGEATILRPAIIVGDSATGRCTSFFGWYIFMQAVHLLSRLLGGEAEGQPFDLKLGLPVNADSTMNIVPVDYVAQAAVRIIENPANHRQIFHLTHPNPPTYQRTLDFVKRRFPIEGVQLMGAGEGLVMKPRNELEQLVYRQMESVLAYFGNNPVFDRDNTDRALPELKPPAVSDRLMNRWLDYAIDNDWGQ
jgi:thioester reductase-like protein